MWTCSFPEHEWGFVCREVGWGGTLCKTHMSRENKSTLGCLKIKHILDVHLEESCFGKDYFGKRGSMNQLIWNFCIQERERERVRKRHVCAVVHLWESVLPTPLPSRESKLSADSRSSPTHLTSPRQSSLSSEILVFNDYLLSVLQGKETLDCIAFSFQYVNPGLVPMPTESSGLPLENCRSINALSNEKMLSTSG